MVALYIEALYIEALHIWERERRWGRGEERSGRRRGGGETRVERRCEEGERGRRAGVRGGAEKYTKGEREAAESDGRVVEGE